MKERPILMSAPMVRALLAGTKTQTRRVVKPAPQTVRNHRSAEWDGDPSELMKLLTTAGRRCPYGEPGDRLRVKEAAWMWCERRPNGKTKTGRDKWVYVPMREAPIHYAADHPKKPAIDVVSPTTGNTWGWRLKIGRFLPRWASRITLEVTGVRVERLQEISADDCWADGIPYSPDVDPVHEYRNLWERINGPESWAANPWVWVGEFRRLEKTNEQG